MVMQSLRKGSSGGFLKYILFGILGMSVGGLVVMDVTGVFNTGGIGGTDVAKVEGRTISIQEFDRKVRRSLARYNIPVEKAYEMGLVDEILSNDIRALYLLIEAEKMGVQIDKKHLAKKIAEIVKPQMMEGEKLQDALNRILQYQRMPEKEFVKNVGAEATGNILMNTITDAMDPSRDDLAKVLFQFQNQTRDIEFVAFLDNEINDYEKPTEKQIKSLYDSIKSQKYQTPEYRSSEVIVFNPDDFDVTPGEISEDEMNEFYEDNIDRFSLGEQYFITQIITSDEAAAQAVYEQVQNGKTLKEIFESDEAKGAQYSENISFETEMMLPEFYDSLSAINVGETAKPFKTVLGYHVAKLNEVRDPEVIPFEKSKSAIKKQIEKDKKADALFEVVSSIDEELADGMSFEEAKEKYKGAELHTVVSIDQRGRDKDGKEPLQDIFDAEGAILITQALFENIEDEPSPLFELENGSFVSVKTVEKQDADYTPFSEVRAEVERQYVADIQNAENEMQVRKFLAEVETSKSSLKELAKEKQRALQNIYDISLSGEMSTPLLQQNTSTIFQAIPGDVGMMQIDGGYALFNVTDFMIPEANNENLVKIEEIKAALEKDTQDEALLMYLGMLNGKYEAKINKALLDNVYGRNTGAQ